MISIINGTRYNTETAEWVGDYRSRDECGNPHYVTDFGFYYADLHRTKKGAWFVRDEIIAVTAEMDAAGNKGKRKP